MDYTEEQKFALPDTGATNWGAVLNAIFEAVDAGREFTLVAGEAIAQYDVVCMKSDGKMWKAKADSLATMFLVGIAPLAVTNGLSGKLRQNGWIENAGWAWTVGAPLYLSVATAGALTETQPSINALPIAVAKTATKIVICPSIFYPATGTSNDFSLTVAGKGFKITEGANATMGIATLVTGTVTVATTKIAANSRILLTSQVDSGTPGFLRVSARTAGTSFTITSSSGADTSDVAWLIMNPV